MIIDVHVHLGGPDDEALLDEFRRNGVAMAIISCLGPLSSLKPYPSQDVVKQANDRARAFAARAPERFRWLAYLNPQNDGCPEELARCKKLGACGVKLLVSLKDSAGRLDRARAVVAEAARQKLPVLIHTWQRTDPNGPGEITIEEFASLAQAVPEAVLIGAHTGGTWRHSLGTLRTLGPNVLTDLSGYFPDAFMVRELVAEVGASRLVFGSDIPGRDLASQLAKVVFAPISDEAKELILWKNSARVFGIKKLAPEIKPQQRPLSELPDFGTEHFCFCGAWPFFETYCATPSDLEGVLQKAGIEKAFTADLGSIYRLDLERVNQQFCDATGRTTRVAPLCALNPRAQNWRRVLANLPARAAGVIVYPYLHNWKLDDPAHAELFEACASKSRPVWINCALCDHRSRHSGLACRPVLVEEAAQFAKKAPVNQYVLQGQSLPEIGAMLDAKPKAQFRFEISRLTDGGGAYAKAFAKYGLTPFVLGSEFPFRDIMTVRWTAQRTGTAEFKIEK